jgi:hypothetical protein
MPPFNCINRESIGWRFSQASSGRWDFRSNSLPSRKFENFRCVGSIQISQNTPPTHSDKSQKETNAIPTNLLTARRRALQSEVLEPFAPAIRPG